jgi:predicted TIM-barrel fold metal-dependent hydrolase
MIVDVHAHYHPRSYRDALDAMPGWGGARAFGGSRHPDSDDEDQVQKRLQMMDDAGVGLQILSPAAGWAPYSNDAATSIAAAKIVNDRQAELISRHPTRFKGLVSLPLPHVDASLSELRRGLDELGFVGVNIHCSVLDQSPAEDQFLPLYEEIDRRGSIVFFHPAGNGARSPLVTEWNLSSAVGTSIEDTLVALHFIGRRIPERFPQIRFIVPHLGGPIAMLLQRLDNQFSMQQNNLPEPPSVTARRFYYDTVGHGSPAALHCAVKAFGADHVLPGSDYPVLLSFETYTDTFSWIREAGLPEADVAQILDQTAQDLFGVAV